MKQAISVFIFLYVPLHIYAQTDVAQHCKVNLANDTLVLENKVTKHYYRWNKGNIALTKIENKDGVQLKFQPDKKGDLSLFSDLPDAEDGRLTQNINRLSQRDEPYLEVSINYSLGSLQILHMIKVFPESPLLSHHFYLKGVADTTWASLPRQNNLDMIEKNQPRPIEEQYIANLGFINPHWTLKIIDFKEATDHNNTLVQENKYLAYNKIYYLSGNIGIGTNPAHKASLIILKESPISSSQHDYRGADFALHTSGLKVLGLGITKEDLNEQNWIRGYGFALGISGTAELDQLSAIRRYQKSERTLLPDRDEMILSNTWGDRSKDSRMNEEFILDELEVAHKLGITHLQLDDGWQQGLSKNSASKAGLKWDSWSKSDWHPHKERFPNGFKPLKNLSDHKDLEICLWFNPTKANNYGQWERDANILIGYYKDWGIRVFKIDGIDLNGKASETNLRKMFEKVLQETEGKAVFNIDVTAGRRGGFHYFTEYGNIFLENRYTDWGNYYPHRTLRNLWMLSRYVPAEKLQIEFLNPTRNVNKYDHTDILAPSRIPFDYQVAITLMAQPLAWMELSGLPEKYHNISTLLNSYREHQHKIHKGTILPIGSEPNGYSWTGFQSIVNESQGYLLVFRENHKDNEFGINTWLPAHLNIIMTDVLTQKTVERSTDSEGQLKVHLPRPFSFQLLHYSIQY